MVSTPTLSPNPSPLLMIKRLWTFLIALCPRIVEGYPRKPLQSWTVNVFNDKDVHSICLGHSELTQQVQNFGECCVQQPSFLTLVLVQYSNNFAQLCVANCLLQTIAQFRALYFLLPAWWLQLYCLYCSVVAELHMLFCGYHFNNVLRNFDIGIQLLDVMSEVKFLFRLDLFSRE